MVRSVRSAVAGLAIALLPASVSAQSTTARIELAHFRDSLLAARDTSGLRLLERRLRASVDLRTSDDLTRLRLGFVQLRRGEVLQDRSPFRDAEQTFAALVETHADWPTAWFGRGLARLNVAADQPAVVSTLRAFFSGDPIADVATDVANSALADSSFADGLVALGALALQDYDPGHLRAALIALRRVAGQPVARNTSVQLARARVERASGNLDSAWQIVAPLLARLPRNPAVLLESAHVSFSQRDESAAADWLQGLALADSSTAARYRNDLRLMLPDSVLRRFDATEGAARVRVVTAFLEVDEYGLSRSVAARLREHYRRLDHARSAFALPMERYRADGALRSGQVETDMDERGTVWVLHGPPDDHTYLNMLSAPPNESWHYRGDDGGELLFHFIKTDAARGYRRVPSLFDILAMTKPLQATGHGDVKAMAARGEAVQTYGASWTAQTVQDMLYSREAMSPTYGRMLSRGKNGALELQVAERITGDSSIARGETEKARYELPLDAQLDVIAVGSDPSGELLQVAFAIPGGSLYASPTVRPVVYPVRMRVSVIRRGSGEVVAAIDTLRNFVTAEPVPVEGTLFGRLPIHVPSGEYTVRMALETPGRGVLGPRQLVRVAGASAQALDLSDLALGARSIRLPWRTPLGDTLWVNPSRVFRSNEPMQVYFEVTGVSSGAPYHVDLAVFKNDESTPQLAFGFGATSSGVPTPLHREVDISRLKSGSYQLQVTITTPGGERVVRRGEFSVGN